MPDSTLEARRDDRTVDLARTIPRHIKRTVTVIIGAAVFATVGIVAVNLLRGTWMVTPVLSGSMRPGFPVGGVVVSQRVPLSQIAVRDVIVFENPVHRTEEMIHRIIKLTHLPGGAVRIRTQGDANAVPDPWTVVIRTRQVYLIRWSLPLLGYVAIAYQDHRALFLFNAGLALLLLGELIWLKALDPRSRSVRRTREAGGTVIEQRDLGGMKPAASFTMGTHGSHEGPVVRRSEPTPTTRQSTENGAPPVSPTRSSGRRGQVAASA